MPRLSKRIDIYLVLIMNATDEPQYIQEILGVKL